MIAAWRTALLALCLVASTWALDISTLKPQGYVSDFSGVVNPTHRAELERYCRQVEAATTAELAIVTMPTLDGEPIEDIANKLYRQWGIGKKGQNEGLLVLLVTNDRRMRMEVGYGLEGIFPDGFSGSLLRSMRPQLRDRQYGPALIEAAHQIGTRIANDKKVAIDATMPSRRPVNDRRESLVHLLPVAIPVLIFAVIFFMSRNNRGGRGGGGMPFFFPMGGGWGGGGSSGGGFGGYDSNDSFGGFGGGDSGGGGASSDW